MFWSPCIRVDMPIDASLQHARWIASALDPIITVVESSEVTHMNLCMSGAALLAMDRHGLRPLLDRISDLAGERRIELISTSAHGGLLPLMPEAEAIRQITLNDSINRIYFGDGYQPICLWAPMLAVSQKVAEIASKLGMSSLLVDEAAMRVWPAQWTGDRIDSVENVPEVFLLPRSRRATRAFHDGAIRTRHDLDKVAPGPDPYAVMYLITAEDLSPRSSGFRALLATMDQEPTLDLRRLFNHFQLSRSTPLLPSSALSTPEELGQGLPFAPWFQPGNEKHAIQWRVMTRLTDALNEMNRKGLSAVPPAQLLRDVLDRSWRESWWRTAYESNFGPETSPVDSLRSAFDGVRPYLPGDMGQQITGLLNDLGPATATPIRPKQEEPIMLH